MSADIKERTSITSIRFIFSTISSTETFVFGRMLGGQDPITFAT